MARTTKTSIKSEEMTLAKIRDHQGVLFAQNLGDTVITCTVGTTEFQLSQKGSPDSIKVLPKEVAMTSGFQKLWWKKVVSVSEDPEMENEITLLMLGQNEVSINRQREIAEMMQPAPTQSALVEKKCLITGERVFQTVEQEKQGVPPLVDRFADEARNYVATQVPNKDGKLEYAFTKVEM